MSMCMCKCGKIFDSDFEMNIGRDGDCCCDNCAEDLEEEDINFKPCNMMVEE